MGSVKVSELIPYINNARSHSEKQISLIASSISEFGFLNPILIDENNKILAGHGRLMAAKKLKIEEVPVISVKDLTESQKKAYIIADNKIALNSSWDDDLLKLELENLKELDFDLSLTGFTEEELNLILDDEVFEGLIDEDEVPEIEDGEKPVTKLGDIWILGDHRLMCGDSTNTDAVGKLMHGHKADMVFSDPPYNTGMNNKKPQHGSTRLSHMFDDDFSDDEWLSFIDNFCRNFDIYTKENCFIFICLDWRRSHELVPFLKEKWKFSNLIVWDKVVHGLGSDYKHTHELIHVCKKGKPNEANNRNGDKEYQDIWRIQRKIGRDNDHATKKPIELVERAIKHTTSFGDIVLDLFGGSGSTMIACEKNKRTSYIMELEPHYCDVIIKRWQEFTGKDAYLESDQIKYNDKR